MSIVDIEEAVKTWAWTSYQKTASDKSKKLKLEEVQMDVNWSGVKFVADKPKYKDEARSGVPRTQVVFKSKFENTTDNEQEHSFKTERTTSAIASTTLTKGYTKGVNVGLNLQLPGGLLEATAGFGYEMTVDNAESSTKERTLTWSTDGTIKVPATTRMLAELKVQEDDFSCKFTTGVTIRGRVIVNINNPAENNNHMMTVEGNVVDILRNAGGRVENGVIRWEVEGKCDFRYGVEQHIHLRKERM